jgi:DNA-binding PadR family transcriptional regulator
MGYAGEFELLTLLAIAQLGDDAYGVTVRDVLESRTTRVVTLGAIYKTLGRLESKGMVRVTVAPPTGERGGRRKKVYRLTREGRMTVRDSLSDLRQLSEGLEPGLRSP